MNVSKVDPVSSDEFYHSSASLSPADSRWQLVQRIVASKSFVKSSFLTRFLLYVCDRELRGKSDEITEYQIGVRALGRPENYNPGVDNIVRNYARILRKRLDEYFEEEGKAELIRISIPRGGYIPIFSSAEEVETFPLQIFDTATNEILEIQDESPFSNIVLPRFAKWPLRTIAFLLVTALTAGYLGYKWFKLVRPAPLHQFWSQVFNHDRDTLIVPADSGFAILQNLTTHTIHLGDYVAGTYLSAPRLIPGIGDRNWNDLRTQRYTSVVDLNIALSLSHLPELKSGRSAIRYARDLRMEDLKHANAVLIGSVHSNPWCELFQKQLNFSLEYHPEVDDSSVINRHPLPGEESVYRNAWNDDSHRTYTVLAFIPSLDGIGHVVLLEGLNMAGTQAAADFLLDQHAMLPILQKAQRPDGTIQPFELLIETSSIGANATEARIVAERYGLNSNEDESTLARR
jgi:hypothetical protein